MVSPEYKPELLNNRWSVTVHSVIDYKYSAVVMPLEVHFRQGEEIYLIKSMCDLHSDTDILRRFIWMSDSFKHSNGTHLSFKAWSSMN